MGRDGRRTFLVFGENVALFAALRPNLDSEMLQVNWAPPSEWKQALEQCAPWPWAVAGTGEILPDVASLTGRPVAWYWLGAPPDGVPVQTRVHSRWRDLLAEVKERLHCTIADVKLAPNRGLLAPSGELVLSPDLEGLLAMSPHPFRLRPRAAAAVDRLLAGHALPLELVRDSGAVWLEGSG
jgi:hypothetical protein